MKILFLDIDGVLNTNKTRKLYGLDYISSDRVKMLKQLYDDIGGYQIVLSSSWREDERLLSMVRNVLKIHGLRIYDVTPSNLTLSGDRSVEIKRWIETNKPLDIAILDDQADANIGIDGIFFQTNDEEGLTETITKGIYTLWKI